MQNHGTDFLSKLGPKKKSEPRALAEGIVVRPDEIEAVVNDMSKTGKRAADGLRTVVKGLDALRDCGLTGEALVVLVTEKCEAYRTEGGRVMRPNNACVQVVLEALFLKLDEYLAK